jgi:protein-S-isoprenylcysteine O-methyltransferase
MFIPSIKGWRLIVYPAFLICVAGQAIRTLAMITAGPNFHHQIREEKEKEHKLVTWGIYSKLRHPSYFGWFWWSIFTQVVLMNPICTVAWGKASWNFFKLRIEVEEETLVEFFKEDYDNYRKRTPVGIPGIL